MREGCDCDKNKDEEMIRVIIKAIENNTLGITDLLDNRYYKSMTTNAISDKYFVSKCFEETF